MNRDNMSPLPWQGSRLTANDTLELYCIDNGTKRVILSMPKPKGETAEEANRRTADFNFLCDAVEDREKTQRLADALREITKRFDDDWGNFLSKTNIAKSWYSAREIRFMNEFELLMNKTKALLKTETPSDENE